MKYEAQTWHYGVIAQHWAEFENHSADAPEIAYYQSLIERYGQPALDVGCGTGRLLIPYLRAGFDVDGCDISPDMLEHCHKKAQREGFSPQLYAQAMHELDIPRTYKTIYVCNSFGIGSTREQDAIALQRFYQHLEPDGVLILDHQMPYGDGAWLWKDWLKENRTQLDPDFWTAPERDQASDGTEYVMRSGVESINPLEQVLVLKYWVQRWQNGQLVDEEKRFLTTNLYFKNELVLLLRQAGFDDITVLGAFTTEEATPDHGSLVFIAAKTA